MKAISCATVITFCCICFFGTLYGQTPKYEAGLRLSGLIYQGDLSPSPVGSYKSPTLGIGFFATGILNKSLSIRANVDLGSLKDADANYNNPSWKQYRNFNFKTTFTELSAHLVYNLKSNYRFYNFASYVFGGAAVTFLNVKRDASGFQNDFTGWQDWVVPGLAEDLATTPPKVLFTVPVGLGFRTPINDNLTLFGEVAYRFMFSDYVDGFSKSADRKWNDHYSNLSLGIIYTFGGNGNSKGIGCPKY